MVSVLASSTEPVIVPSRTERVGITRAIRRWIYHRLMRMMMLVHRLMVIMARVGGSLSPQPSSYPPEGGWRILLTGTFHADNWVKAHLLPLAQSAGCAKVWVVSASPVPEMPKVSPIYPPAWMIRILGQTPARIMTFAWIAIYYRPDVVGGFALFVNGLASAVLAPLINAKSLYFCVGGPVEVQDGGVWTESGPLAKMETPDPVVERRLLRVVGSMDHVITMGSGARQFFQGKGVTTDIRVISGGIDAKEFQPSGDTRLYDMVLAGRLTEIKRIDNFLHIVQKVAQAKPETRALILGDGHLRENLERLTRELGIEANVHFAGHQRNMGEWFRQSRIFVLTSESEGLSLALMEAMTCGLPGVVSNVGDLGDLVNNGVNGYLVDRYSIDAFAERILSLLTDETRYSQFVRAARDSASQYEISQVTGQWSAIFPQPTLHQKGSDAHE